MTLDTFDLMIRNLMGASPFVPAREFKYEYPVDVIVTEDALELRVAAIGLNKEDIEIEIAGDRLGITYDKDKKDSECSCAPCVCTSIHRGIARRAFSLAYKISARFDLSQLKATLEKGELILTIPIKEDAKPLKIKIS
jgi:HSP20 family molecular chaperone IbpA